MVFNPNTVILDKGFDWHMAERPFHECFPCHYYHLNPREMSQVCETWDWDTVFGEWVLGHNPTATSEVDLFVQWVRYDAPYIATTINKHYGEVFCNPRDLEDEDV